MSDINHKLSDIQDRILQAIEVKQAVSIVGGNSKSFAARESDGERLSVSGLKGIRSYEPTELVITAAAGTLLKDINDCLAEQQQMLAFEPPSFSDMATIGGTVACGISGSRRPFTGSVRDFVLGISCINGKAERLRFGGQVMKNVAGYDLSRLLTGSWGTLAVITEVSLKVLPVPEKELTLVTEMEIGQAIKKMREWCRLPLPLSGLCYLQGHVYYRLSGAETAVMQAQNQLDGDVLQDSVTFWQQLREQQLEFFEGDMPLWRCSVPPSTLLSEMENMCCIDWAGGLRWWQTDRLASEVFSIMNNVGGHAQLFRGGDKEGEVFQPLSPSLLALHQRLKKAFDPAGILNPGVMYSEN